MFKKYSLALGGGGALGLAHIGVIKHLEEKNIKINEISGTSMGAIVASFYAIGKDSNYMYEYANSINFFKLLDFDLQNGLLKGQKIYNKLYEVFGDKKIEELEIKLKIVSTNIETGKIKIFETGKIIDAIRSSISLPGIFKPYKINSNNFIDGGVLCNLPIEILKGKNIISVSVTKNIVGSLVTKKQILGFNFNVGFFNLNYQILRGCPKNHKS